MGSAASAGHSSSTGAMTQLEFPNLTKKKVVFLQKKIPTREPLKFSHTEEGQLLRFLRGSNVPIMNAIDPKMNELFVRARRCVLFIREVKT